MKKRYIGADIWRSLALLWVMVYHAWVLFGSPAMGGGIVLTGVKLGGEIGVTMFFVLSGFGMYVSLEANFGRNGQIDIKEYVRSRAKRILPDYYGFMLLAVMLTGTAVYLSIHGVFHILAHVLFIHNLFPATHGTVNGVLWTMGVIVQFYIAAPFLYKAVRKKPLISLVFSIAVSILTKALLFHMILPRFDVPAVYSFIFSRQLITSLDNFVTGMVLAKMADVYSSDKKHVWMELTVFLLLLLWCSCGDRSGIYTDNFSGYVWHSGLAVLLGLLVFVNITSKRVYDGILAKALRWLARNEYGIYIWHYLVMENLLAHSEILQICLAKGAGLAVLAVLIAASIVTGSLLAGGMSLLTDKWLLNFKRCLGCAGEGKTD